MKKLDVEGFYFENGEFSHYSVVILDENGEIVELASCVVHEFREDAVKEMEETGWTSF